MQLLARCTGHVDVQALGLVNPLLAARGGFHQPLGRDFKRGGVEVLDLLRHAVDGAQRAVEVLEVHDHHVVPQAQALQVTHQVLVDDGEFTRQIGLHGQVAERRLDRCIHAHDVGDGGSRSNGHAVGVAHAVLGYFCTQSVPVQLGRAIHFHVAATGLFQQLQGVGGQDALIPQRALEGGVSAALLGQLGRGPVSVVADGFHGFVGELDGALAGVGRAHFIQRVLEAHQAHAHGAVAQVGILGLLHGVVVDVDHVVQHAHGRVHGLAQLVVVDLAVLDVLDQVHGAQVADRGFGVAGVERDLGAQIGRVHHTHVLLGRADVARVLEGDPGVAGLEQHREHLSPQVHGGNALGQLELAAVDLGLIGGVGLLEGFAVQVVQIGRVGGREQSPLALFHHALHEQVGNPVRRIHVVGAAAVVAGVLAQLQELFDVQVPRFQIRADCALALAALVHGHGRVVDHLQERNHALRFTIGALDARAQGTHAGPVIAQTARKLGQQSVFLDGLVDAVQVIGHGGQVAGRQLRAQCAAVEQRGGGRHEVKRGQQLVELDGACIAVIFLQRQAHGHAHEEGLGQLDAGLLDVQEVAVVQRLQAQVVELFVALGLQGLGQTGQVVVQQLGVEQFVVHALLDEAGEVVGVSRLHFSGLHIAAHDFAHDGVQQQAGGDVGVVGIFFDQRTGGQDRGLEHFAQRHAVVQVAQCFGHDGGSLNVGIQIAARGGNQGFQALLV